MTIVKGLAVAMPVPGVKLNLLLAESMVIHRGFVPARETENVSPSGSKI